MTTLMLIALGVLIGSTLNEKETKEATKGYRAPSGTYYLP